MYRLETVEHARSLILGQCYTLGSEIPAIQILPAPDGGTSLSPVSKLPEGAEIAPCGQGFDGNTMKVSSRGQFYYVFLRDLEMRESLTAGVN